MCKMADDVISKLRESTGRIRLHLADGNDVEVAVEEMDYQPAEEHRRGPATPGRYWASLVETDDLVEAFDLPAAPESVAELRAKEHKPCEWGAVALGLSKVYVESTDVEKLTLAEVDSVERID